jgi:nucleoside-diphosphate-sugar epimerase
MMTNSVTDPANYRYLIFGPKGWIGSTLLQMLKEQGKTVKVACVD